MQNQYAKLLSPHFEGEDLENLIKIIGIMQAPDSFEFGILQLETLNLYGRFNSFLRDYVGRYDIDFEFEFELEEGFLINYMFADTLRCQGEYGDKVLCSVSYSNCDLDESWLLLEATILFPLFCKKLCYYEFDEYSDYKPEFVKTNLGDIIYPIHRVDDWGGFLLGKLGDDVKILNLYNVDVGLEQRHFPSQLEALHILNGRYIQRNALLHLKKLRLFKFRLNEDILNWQFPPNILKLCIDGRYWEDDIEIILYILEQNPKLQIIEGVCFGDNIEELLKQHFFEHKGGGVYERGFDHIL